MTGMRKFGGSKRPEHGLRKQSIDPSRKLEIER